MIILFFIFELAFNVATGLFCTVDLAAKVTIPGRYGFPFHYSDQLGHAAVAPSYLN